MSRPVFFTISAILCATVAAAFAYLVTADHWRYLWLREAYAINCILYAISIYFLMADLAKLTKHKN